MKKVLNVGRVHVQAHHVGNRIKLVTTSNGCSCGKTIRRLKIVVGELIFIYLLASFNGVFSQSGEKLQTFYILFLDPCTNLFCVPVPKFYILIHVSVLYSLQIMKLFPRAIHTKDRFFKLGLWKLIPKIEVLK